jgi:hypothetical protein
MSLLHLIQQDHRGGASQTLLSDPAG